MREVTAGGRLSSLMLTLKIVSSSMLQCIDYSNFCFYKKVDQYTIFKIMKLKGKKNLENWSMHNAILLPLQKVIY